jgi:hypothetical protein
MKASQQFPNDDNGDVLRRLYAGGDELTHPRIIDFCFIFPDRKRALVFAEDVDDRDFKVCISYYKEKAIWQVIVKNNMIPEHKNITSIESSLSIKAHAVGGKADGWGCMRIERK